ncbi:DUF4468 domain-containing protein [Flavicella sp.]|uniref:DUF4468 domain-containing protein n=1 Tax=Flavicella sp. TaxID=2957742 RepID=UPI003015EA42
MKKLVLFFLFITASVSAQFKVDYENVKVSFEQVYKVDSLTALSIHKRANEWIALNFNNSKNVIRLDSGSKIIVKGMFQITTDIQGHFVDAPIYFDMITEFKEGKYRLSFVDYVVKTQGVSSSIEGHAYIDSFENHKEQIEKLQSNTTDPYLKRYYKKLLNSEDELRKMYKNGLDASRVVLAAVERETVSLANSLYRYILAPENTGDW